MGSGMVMGGAPVLPDSLRFIWVGIYVVIAVLHVGHASHMGGQLRAWHLGHTLMALGMIYMFLPASLITLPSTAPVPFIGQLPISALPTSVGAAVFALAALAIVGWIGVAVVTRHALDLLWFVLLVDMLGMIYMFEASRVATGIFTALATMYFALEAGCWAIGAFDQHPGQQLTIPAVVGGRGARTLTPVARPLAAATSLELRITLALMAAGMAYMFLAMQA